jgi:TIR domain
MPSHLEQLTLVFLALVALIQGYVVWNSRIVESDLSRRRSRPRRGNVAMSSPRAIDLLTPSFDLFIIYAAADAIFVHEHLLPSLDAAGLRVLLVDELIPGAPIAVELDRGVTSSRFTIIVLSPAYFEDCVALLGEQLTSYISAQTTHLIPLRLVECRLPLRLEARVALDFTNRSNWAFETSRLCSVLRSSSS